MAEGGEEAQDVARGALDARIRYTEPPEGGAEIAIHISTTNIRVAKELCKLAGYAVVGTTLGVLLGYKVLKPLVESAVKKALGEVDKITPGSLRVVIHCLTDERFLEIFKDYETGKMKTRLEDEFAQVGIEVEGLKVKIENIEEVNKTKKEIYKKRNARRTLKEMTTEAFSTSARRIRKKISRTLNHLNHSLTCFSYALYRRLPLINKIDIAVIFVSEYVDDGGDIKQLKDYLNEGYVRSDKGMARRVRTDRLLQMHLDFPGIELSPFVFKIDKPQLDSVGFAVNHFKRVSIESPARGNIKICEKDSDENLWILNLNIYEERIIKIAQKSDDKSEVVHRTTKLTKMEITRVSRMVAMDWDSLAGLMDIPYEEREEIRTNHAKYPDSLSKAEEILIHFNDSDCFDRDVLAKSLVELGRRDLKDELLPMLDEDYKTRSVLRLKAETVKKTGKSKGDGTEEMQELQTEIAPEGNDQPLSPREMFRLSRRIAVDWDRLAGLMDIAKEQRDEIRCNVIYSDNRSRAEKILSIFNHRNEFSRERLVECLKELERYDLIETIITGKWKFL